MSTRLPRFDVTEAEGLAMHDFMRVLKPFRRSITGAGLRETLEAIQLHIPLTIESVPSGQQVLDWTVPPEWSLHEAYVADLGGKRVLDSADSALRVVGYSEPMDRRMPIAELRQHLHTVPGKPDWLPYRTAYYERDWGFCVTQPEFDSLTDAEYDVRIESVFMDDGRLNYGEAFFPGESPDEVLISAHVCHPEMANDNLSGIAVAVALAERIAAAPHRLSYRFLFVPGTIGSISWLARNEQHVERIRHGLVLAGIGDAKPLTYKRSRRGGALVDRVFEYLQATRAHIAEVVDFEPYGYDERQYCSPGFDLPVGALMRSKYGTYPEYHTSADTLDFVSAASLADCLKCCLEALAIIDGNATYRNLAAKGEPQLGRRGLYGSAGGTSGPAAFSMAMLWVLSYSDGEHDLLWIADRAPVDFATIVEAAYALAGAGLLGETSSNSSPRL